MIRPLLTALLAISLLAPAANASVASAPARDINGLLVTAELEMQELAKLPSVQGAGDAAQCNRDVAQRTNVRYSSVGAANLQGELYCLAPASAVVSIADRAYFLRALGLNGLGVGDYQVGRATRVTGLGLGYPVRGTDGKPTGVVISPLSLSFLSSFLASRAARTAVDTLVIDGHATVLARVGQRPTATGQSFAANRLARSMLATPRSSGAFNGLRYAWTTVPKSDGSVHVAVGVRP